MGASEISKAYLLSTEISTSHVSASVAVWSCAAMAFFYVAILYSPTLILRLPPPTSLQSFMLRRFACAAVSSATSLFACVILLRPANFDDWTPLLRIFGIRGDYLWQAVMFPLFLTSLMYAGSFTRKLWQLTSAWEGRGTTNFSSASQGDRNCGYNCINRIVASACNVLVWRNYVVAPITEELVFRACMIPLLLCGGFKISSIIFFTPIFFSLGNKAFVSLINKLMKFAAVYCISREFTLSIPSLLGVIGVLTCKAFSSTYHRTSTFESFTGALLSAKLQSSEGFPDCLQLGYTVIFGWYASFLFIRTGNLISPIVAHVFCNMMGLPVYSSSHTKGAATIAFSIGVVSFFYFLFPATNPDLYNEESDNCSCWHGYCSWKV